MADLEIIAIHDIGEVRPGDDLAELIAAADDAHLQDGDCLVITQKVVSKAEGRSSISTRPIRCRTSRWSRRIGSHPAPPRRTHHLSDRTRLRLRQRRHRSVECRAGSGRLLPVDSDRSAAIRDRLRARHGHDVAVIISDTFGRPWRRGVTDVAIGCAGIRAVADLRGTTDALGRELMVTEVAVVDEIAAAADLVMGKAKGVAVAIVRGLEAEWFGRGSVVDEIVRDPADDLFR